MTTPEPCVDTCIGRDGTGGCPHPPRFIVAGDNSCVYHLVTIVRMRSKDTGGGPVEVDPNWVPVNDGCPICDGGTGGTGLCLYVALPVTG